MDDTTARVGILVVGGDRAFTGLNEDLNPTASADIEWRRVVFTLELYHQFTANVGAAAVLPYYEQDVHNRTTGTDNHVAGIGDVAAYLLWSPWATADTPKEMFHPGNVLFSVGLSLPTGDELAGELPGLHSYHLGSGSLEFKLGARYQGWINEQFALFAGTATVIDEGANSIGFRYGTSVEFYLGAAYTLEVFSTYVAFDAINRDKDRIGPVDLDNSGGTWWFVELGAAVSPTQGVTFESSLAFPIYIKVNGTQPVADLAWSLGARYRF